ncbi:MAG: uroporphyrinogen decarboxylase family protein [Terrimicrobiaceae bacterium]
MMTPHERILATLNRKPADRTPVDLWCTPEVLNSLRRHTGKTEELEVYRSLGLDKIVWVFPDYSGISSDPNEPGGGHTLWGVPLRTMKSGLATYQEFGTPPLGDYDDLAQLDDYPLWPDPAKFDYAGARRLALKARDFGFATIGPWISHFEIYCQMRGLENAMMDVVAEPDFLDAALARIDAIQTAMLDRFLSDLGDTLDIVFISDDMGSQQSLLISLPAWDAFFRERLTRWCSLIHRHGKKVLFHTDGSARDLVPGLIAAGVDILNPIQHICPGMDCAGLDGDFGGQILFHGGVDNQHVLPFGSPNDVAAEVRMCLETLGRGGSGYICCSCHNVQAGTPVENILAMIETVHRSRLTP